jgi:hypothetical protein
VIRSHIARAGFAEAAAVALPIGGVVALTSNPAGASTVKIKCATFSGSATAGVTLSNCTGTGVVASDNDGPAQSGGIPWFPGNQITWTNSQTTGLTSPTATAVSPNACGKHKTESKVTGTVAASTVLSPGAPYKAFVCVNTKTGAVSLGPGKIFKISSLS